MKLLMVILAAMILFKGRIMESLSNPTQSTSIALGFILLFAFLLGKKISRFSLPRITGYIFAGIIAGPYVLNLLNVHDVHDLQLLDGLALSLIALTAGGEMRWQELRRSFRTISMLVIFQTLFIIAGFVGLIYALGSFFPIADPQYPGIALIAGLLLGTLATATSPSTTIAVINETRSEGKMTDLILSTAVVKDFFVIGLFAFTLSFSKSFLTPDRKFDIGFLIHILRDVGGSVLIGILIGTSIILYLKYIRRDIAVFILAVAFFSYQISHSYGFHPLMICLIAGFMVENFSSHGKSLIRALEKSSPPVYVIFFAISGAALNLDALKRFWILALVIVVWRGILKFAGTYVGAAVSRAGPVVRRKSWTGFISQAGVALGMAIVIEKTFPSWGGIMKTLVLAVIAINQIVGPVLLQRFLVQTKEAGLKGRE